MNNYRNFFFLHTYIIHSDSWQVLEHYLTRVRGNLLLMEQLDMVGRTSELARLFGIQFYEVFTRGSQVGLHLLW